MAAVSGASHFVGRRPELVRLHALIDAAAAGQSAAVLVAGDAGVGKTSLAAEFVRAAREGGTVVLTGHNVDLGAGGLPYLPFAEALNSAVRGSSGDAARDVVSAVSARRAALGRLLGQTVTDDGADRFALFEAVVEALTELSQTVAPTVLVIEDLHWAEESTRDLLRFLLSRLAAGDARLLVLATYRAEDLHRRHPVRALLSELRRVPAVESMELRPFDPSELGEFLTSLNGTALPDTVVRRIGDRSSGNAYFAEELLAAGPDQTELPTGLSDVLLDRYERRDADTRQLVRAAAVLGSSRIEDGLLRAVAADASGLDDSRLNAALREAVAHNVLRTEESDRFGADRFAFRHALLQEAIYTDLLPAERVRLHSLAASRLAERRDTPSGRPGDAAEQARHAAAARDLPQALAASLLAADAARARLAPAEALAQYQEALQLWTVVEPRQRPPDVDVIDIGLRASDVAAAAGRLYRAVDLAEQSLRDAEDVADRDAIRRAASRLAWHESGVERFDDAFVHAQRVIDDHPGTANGGVADDPTAALVWARAAAGRARAVLALADAARAVLEPGLLEARALGMSVAEAGMLLSLSTADRLLGRPGAEEHLARARAVAQASGDRETMMRAAYVLVVDHFEEGEYDAAIATIAEALALLDQAGLGSSLWAGNARWMLVHAYWLRGDPDSAVSAVAEAVATLPKAAARQVRLAGLTILAARDPALTLAEVDDLHATDPNPGNAYPRWFARAEAEAWRGDLESSTASSRMAVETLDGIGEAYSLAGIAISTSAVAVLADVAAAARTSRDEAALATAVADARVFIDDARDRAALGKPRRFVMGPEGLAWLTRLDAEAARLTGDDTAAQWQAAAEAFNGVSVYERARARWRWAQRLLADGDRDAARAQIAAARETAGQLGAAPLAAALDDLARRGRLDRAAGTRTGEVLTARERDVMRLVADGLTNRLIGERLFISEKTASVHVSNVLTKLGASGRAEAVAIATRDGLLD